VSNSSVDVHVASQPAFAILEVVAGSIKIRSLPCSLRSPGPLLCLLCGIMVSTTLSLPAGETATQGTSERSTIALEALSRLKGVDLDANPAVKAAVLKVLSQVRGTPQFVEIVGDFKIADQEPALLEFAAQNPATSAGVQAVKLVLNGPHSDALKTALSGTNAAKIVEALANTNQKEIIPFIEPLLADNSRELEVRKAAVRAMARVQEGALKLVRMAKEQKLAAELVPTASSELHAARWEDLKAEASKVLPFSEGRNSDSLPPISELVARHGDITNGAAVFRRDIVGCIKCHQVNGEGIDFGPNLSEIGTKLGKDALYQAILEPSAGISFGFEAWQIELKNGDEAYGLIANETPEEVSVKSVGGVVTRYKTSEILKRTRQKLSIMPAGLEHTMSTQELVDLVEYLASLKKAAGR
jgi:putative heme-binding domain-containing protein